MIHIKRKILSGMYQIRKDMQASIFKNKLQRQQSISQSSMNAWRATQNTVRSKQIAAKADYVKPAGLRT